MQKRCGGKFGGDHTTFIDLAAVMTDIAVGISSVRKISAGYIQVTPEARGERRVKFIDKNGGVLLKVRQSCSVQEVLLITDNLQEVKLFLARAARNMGVHISFKKPS